MDDLLYLGIGIGLFLAALWFVRGGESESAPVEAQGGTPDPVEAPRGRP